MRKIVGTLIAVTILAISHTQAEEKKGEDFHSRISRAVIRLEHTEQIRREGNEKSEEQKKPDGTAFFVRSGDNLFVVSARHMVEKEYVLHARVECVNNKSNEKEMISLTLPGKGWILHPREGNQYTRFVDVAVMKIPGPKDRTVWAFTYEPGDQKKNQLPENDPFLPRGVRIFGFPNNIGFELKEQKPLERTGIVVIRNGNESRKIDGKFEDEKCYVVNVINAKMFGGDSGGPVTGITKSKVELLGLVIGSNQNNDIAIVEPVSRIREVLEIEQTKKQEPRGEWFPIGK